MKLTGEMMKLTNGQIADSVPGLKALSEVKLPVKLAFKLGKLMRELDGILKPYELTLRKLQEEHAAARDGDKIVLKDPEAYHDAVEELREIENEVNFDQISLNDLGEIELEPQALYSLDWLLID